LRIKDFQPIALAIASTDADGDGKNVRRHRDTSL
jgi:hypothetical protein